MVDYLKIIKLVAKKHGITLRQLLGPLRIRHLVTARSEAAHILRNDLGLTYPAIGLILGRRDHTTIINLLQHHKNMEELQKVRAENYRIVVESLENSLLDSFPQAKVPYLKQKV